MADRIKLFVVDTGPLITLVAAETAGRRASRVEKMPEYDSEIRAAIEALVVKPP